MGSQQKDGYQEQMDACLICESPSNGSNYHHGISSCRSCGMFFRRAINGAKKFVCRRQTNLCTIHYKLKQTCKSCRFEKCIYYGMRMKNQRFNNLDIEIKKEKYEKRQLPPSTVNKKVNLLDLVDVKYLTKDDPCIKSMYGKSLADKWDKVTIENGSLHYDTSECLAKVTQILKGSLIQVSPSDSNVLPTMYPLMCGIKKLMSTVNPKNPKEIQISKYISIRKYVLYCEEYFLELAVAVMHSPLFGKLSFDDRRLAFSNLYPIFSICASCYSSCEFFGYDSEKNYLLFNGAQAYELLHGFCAEKEMTPEDCLKLYSALQEPHYSLLHAIYIPMKELKFNFVEFCYMIHCFLFSPDTVDGFSAEGKALLHNYNKQISDEMHNYYHKVLKLENYAYRITQQIKIINKAQRFHEWKKDVLKIYPLFNVIDASELYHEKNGFANIVV
uniref:Nuclear receptor domain-containing protein n=1 Tax=Rhabditophanes sp. KR3021 TaxID=114890 RepID=A0AC35UD99_9BILA